MNILQLNTYEDWGGAAKAAYRLNRGLQGIGVNSRMLVQSKSSDAKDVLGTKDPLMRFAYGVRTNLGTIPVGLYKNKPLYNFSPALLPDRVASQVAGLSPDILHLHWLAAGLMRIETLNKFKQPLVWTLHDSWAFTGGCHIPYQCIRYQQMCGSCPVLGSKWEADLSRRVWRRKKKAWQDLNLTVVAPSHWLADCASSSSLLNATRIDVIPNGIDLTVYKPIDKMVARDLLGLSPTSKLILSGAINCIDDTNKGFDFLLPTMQRVAAASGNDTELLFFGASEPAAIPCFGLKATYFGRLHEDISIALLYAAADVFVAPSIQENLPNTIMESMACGTPCVAFRQGGVPDLIEHERNGYLARPFEPDDLAQGIMWVLEDEGRRKILSAQARQKVVHDFDLVKVAKRYAGLYQELMTGRRT